MEIHGYADSPRTGKGKGKYLHLVKIMKTATQMSNFVAFSCL